MRLDLVKFDWPVPESGYCWINNPKGTAGEMLTDEQREMADDGLVLHDEFEYQLVPLREWPFRNSQPLSEHTGLFRQFASLGTGTENILRFANDVGNLGAEFDAQNWGANQSAQNDRERAVEKMLYRSVDTHGRWMREIAHMRTHVELWEAIEGGKAGPEAMDRIRSAINGVLAGDQVTVRFEKNSQLNREFLHIVPKSLLGAMWVQFAQAVANDKKYRNCSTCGKWFEIAPDTARTSRTHCSEACKSRAYRHRQARARDLAREGRSPSEIAIEVGSDLKTVKKWLKQAKN